MSSKLESNRISHLSYSRLHGVFHALMARSQSGNRQCCGVTNRSNSGCCFEHLAKAGPEINCGIDQHRLLLAAGLEFKDWKKAVEKAA